MQSELHPDSDSVVVLGLVTFGTVEIDATKEGIACSFPSIAYLANEEAGNVTDRSWKWTETFAARRL
jgi:hypothetical protein